MKRQFTARQISILHLILRLSWGCNKEHAVIPVLSDFEICGIHRSDITIELNRLTKERVIFWDRESGQFAFNKDFDQWAVSFSLPAIRREGQLEQLLALNLSPNCPPIPPSLRRVLDLKRPLSAETQQNNGFFTQETQQDKALYPQENSYDVGKRPTSVLVKDQQAVGDLPTTPDTKSNLVKKEKESIKEIDTSATVWEPMSKNFGQFCTIYQNNIGMLAPILAQDIDNLAMTYELHWFEEAVKEAVRMNKRALKYVSAILERWGREGFKAPMGRRTGMPAGRPPNPPLPTGEDLRKAWGERKP